MRNKSAKAAGFFGRFSKNRQGNVLMIFGFALVPLLFSVGMGIDYSRAMRLETKLNAAADAAALAAVAEPVMGQSSSNACAIARKMFIGQSTGITGLVMDPTDATQLVITVTDSASQNGAKTSTTCTSSGASAATTASFSRTVAIAYHAKSNNAFAGILGLATLNISGASQTNAAVAPNIDFYVMIDTSPSMLLPATSDGLAKMIAATPGQGGCAFACHQIDTRPSVSSDISSNPIDPTDTTDPANNKRRLDNYALARAANIILRTDLVTSAVQDLTQVATDTATTNHATYRMGISQFDRVFKQVWPTSPLAGYNVDPNLTTVKSHVGDAQILEYCHNNQLICNTSSADDNDTGSNFTNGFSGSLLTMPLLPGSGTNQPLDTPQAMLFIITDGMRDENNSGRQIGPIPTTLCDTIKNRGIRIAILDTQYLPASASDSWSITNVKTPYLSPTDKITPQLTSCASPGLFYQVTTDSDISAALSALFQKAVATAHLVQ